jgi:hypothetical protein
MNYIIAHLIAHQSHMLLNTERTPLHSQTILSHLLNKQQWIQLRPHLIRT